MGWLVFAVVCFCCGLQDAAEVTVTSQSITEKNELTVTCEASGQPVNYTFYSFKHSWYTTEIRKLNGTKVGLNRYVLRIPCAGYEDSGVYRCYVDNGVPNADGSTIQTNTTLAVVKAKPKLIRQKGISSGIIADIGEELLLVKTIFSDPHFTSYNWSGPDDASTYVTSIEQVKISFSIHNQLAGVLAYDISLSIASLKHAGTYTLTVCNEVGCSLFPVNVTAAGPPLAPKEFRKEAESTSDTVMLSWLPNYPGGNFKQRFLVEYKARSDSEWKTYRWFEDPPQGQKVFASITNLEAKQTYDVRVSARTNRSAKNNSDFVKIEVKTKDRQQSAHVDGLCVATYLLIGFAIGFVVGFIVAALAVMEFVRRRGYIGKQGDNSTGYEQKIPENGLTQSSTGNPYENSADSPDYVTPDDIEISAHF